MKPLSIASLYKFADKTDIILLCCGMVFAIGCGVGMPLFMVFFGNFFDAGSTADVDYLTNFLV